MLQLSIHYIQLLHYCGTLVVYTTVYNSAILTRYKL